MYYSFRVRCCVITNYNGVWKSNISAPLINLEVKTMNYKNKMKKKDFKIPKNTRIDNQSIKHNRVTLITQKLYYIINIKVENV